jgi:hypothetical protein
MVETNGGRGQEAHTAAPQQLLVAARTGAHDERVGIAHVGSTNVCTFYIYGIGGYLADGIAYIGYLIVDYYLHITRKST